MTPKDENRRTLARLRRRRLSAFFVILFERLAIHGWRLTAWCMFFAGLWMSDLSDHILIAFLFAAGCLYFFIRDIIAFRLPSEHETDRRLEKDNALKHRPLSTLKDTLANPKDNKTQELWLSNKEALLTSLKTIKAPSVRPIMPHLDPYGLRFIVTLVFVVGFMIAGTDALNRVQNGLKPISYNAPEKTDRIAITIIPPEYTGLQQMTLSESENKTLYIPEGSKIKATVSGGWSTPELKHGEKEEDFEKISDKNYALETTISNGSTLAIRQAIISRGAWNYKIIEDEPPAIALRSEPKTTPNAQVQIPISVYDDYGVRDIRMHMDLDEMVLDAPLGEPVNEYRSVMSPGDENFEFDPVYDLTSHSWAGLPVTISLTVMDHKNQIAQTGPIKLILPERQFRHPVAREIIALRKKLAWELNKGSKDIAKSLETLMAMPSTYHDDNIVFLALRSASSRLWYDDSLPSIRSVIDLLWNTALRIEDGEFSLAARDLRDAQLALEETLKNPDATDQEIAKRMQELREAMAKYLQEMIREMQKRMADGQTMPMINPQALTQMLDPQALSAFLDQMESEMMSGDRQSAQEMLSQLQRMMDNLNPSVNMTMPPDMQNMIDSINGLQELIEKQQTLLDRTKKKQQYKTKTQTEKDVQEGLRRILGQIMMDAAEAIPEIPPGLGLAEQEMRQSTEQLAANNPGGSTPHQEKALEHLKEGMQNIGQELMSRMQSATGFGLSGMPLDPLGRPYGEGQNGMFPGSRVQIPDEAQRRYVDEILQILRRRSGELSRPEEELEYFRRLLRQF